jgi:HEAT repeat protein
MTVLTAERRTVGMVWPDMTVGSNESVRRMAANALGMAAVPQLVEALLPFAQGTVGDHDPLAAAKARLAACRALEAAGVQL